MSAPLTREGLAYEIFRQIAANEGKLDRLGNGTPANEFTGDRAYTLELLGAVLKTIDRPSAPPRVAVT